MWIQIFENDRLLIEQEVHKPFRVGRQVAEDPAPFQLVDFQVDGSDVQQKLIVASKDEREYSRNFLDVYFDGEQIQLTNVSSNQTIPLMSGGVIEKGQSRLVNENEEVTLINRTLVLGMPSLDRNSSSGHSIFTLSAPLPPLHEGAVPQTNMTLMHMAQGSEIDGDRLLEWLRAMLHIFQLSPANQSFFDHAGQVLVRLLELDHAAIAFRGNFGPDFQSPDQQIWYSDWRSQVYCGNNQDGWRPSRQILDLVVEKQKTIFEIPTGFNSNSLLNINNLVASPLLDTCGTIIGVVYGDRFINPKLKRDAFSKTEAMFVELFASAISTGMARLEQERQLANMRTKFDQFFTADLARKIETDPRLLDGRAANVSVLFCDIRGFSRIAERIGPEQTIHWINSVMGELSQCISEHDGVVVDYIGDEVMAMWGAPAIQENHAELAVGAAVQMVEILPGLNRQWEQIIGEPFDIGIGINSGTAQVGNTGSAKKFKYGPLGHTVNIGSRIQGATKQIGSRLLVSEATARQLGDTVATRRIRSIRLVNVREPVTVYEVQPQPTDDWIQLKDEYESSLQLFESGNLRPACKQLAALVSSHPEDGPSLLLLSHVVKELADEDQEFDPVWELASK